MTGEKRGWLALAVLLVVGLQLAGCEESKVLGESETATERGQESAAVSGGSLELTVLSGVGQVEVRPGDSAGEVRVEYVKTAYSRTQAGADEELAGMTLRVDAAGSQVTVDSRQPERLDDAVSNKVDLVIYAPAMAALTVSSDVGDVRVHDLTLSGPLKLDAAVGKVIVENVDARAGATLSADVGDIGFAGTLGADAELRADVGKITVELPPGAGVTLDAEATVGKLTITGFDLDSAIKEHTGTGADYRGALGAGGPTLTLRANVGDVTVRASGG